MKRIGFILALLLAAGNLCVFARGNSARSGREEAGNGPVKLTIAVPENLRIEDYKTNIMTRILEQESNVDFEFLILPSVDYAAKVNIMVMTGGSELPDIIVGGSNSFPDSMVYQWAQEGAIIPLTKYYKDPRLSPNLHKQVELSGVNFFSQITSPDGEIYGVPSFNQSYLNEYYAKYFYYHPWAEKAGLKIPTTTEEFRTFLRGIKNSDLNGNGRNDEIPLTGQFSLAQTDYERWFNWIMNAFVFSGDLNLLTVNSGTVGVAYNTPEWRDGLKYIRGLVAEGLIPTETFTQDANQMRTLINQDGPVVFSFVWYNADQVNSSNPAAAGYKALPPLKGPKGIQYATFQPSVATISMVISKNCKNPDAAFRAGDAMSSELIGIMQRFGAEKVDWDYPQNVPNVESNYVPSVPGWPLSIILHHDAEFWGGSGVSNSSWRQLGPTIRTYGVYNGTGNLKASYSQRLRENNQAGIMYQEGGYAPKEVIPKLIYNSEEQGPVTELLTNLQTYATEATAAFLIGTRDINSDTAWNAYLAELNRIGVSQALGIIQQVYNRMYK
jgi:putative aldouronate transport system substrate-binding protein